MPLLKAIQPQVIRIIRVRTQDYFAWALRLLRQTTGLAVSCTVTVMRKNFKPNRNRRAAQAVTHPSTNRARRRVTSMMEIKALLLFTKPDRR